MSRIFLLVALAAGCADTAADTFWGELSCEVKAGHKKTLTLCMKDDVPSGSWATFYEPRRAQSQGEIRHGMLLPPHSQWWHKGAQASRIEGDTLTVWDQTGTNVWATHPVVDGVPVACPEGATAMDGTLESGHRSTWCEVKDGEHTHKVGLQTTFYASGKPESRALWIRPTAGGDSARQGLFVAWHESGERWIQGEYLKGKRHGAWLQWGKDGAIYQQMLEPEWADTKPVPTWYDPGAEQIVAEIKAKAAALDAAQIEAKRLAVVPVGDCGPWGELNASALGGTLSSDQMECMTALVSVEGAVLSYRSRAAVLLWAQSEVVPPADDDAAPPRDLAVQLTQQWVQDAAPEDQNEAKMRCVVVTGTTDTCEPR